MPAESIYIPTYIGSVDYAPARVQPRLLFYNSTKECEPYYISSGSVAVEFNRFPYFDNDRDWETMYVGM